MTTPAETQPEASQVRDADAIMVGIHRKLMTFIGMPRRCHERLCRRARRCVGRDMRCQRDFAGPELTEEEDARVRAEMKHALERELARRAALRT